VSDKRDDELMIVQTLQTNKEKGFELLFNHYYSVLCNHVIRLVNSQEVAQDLVSEAFYLLWKNQHFEQIQSLRAYLFKSVRNLAYNYLQRDLLHTHQDISNLYLSPSYQKSTPESLFEFNELYQKMENAIQTLPPQTKTAFLMSRFEGKTYPEIAEKMNISPKTVEAHISRALKQLRIAFGENLCVLLSGLLFFF
jgi:RNA polymerase sigma-70 factor (ECF subfamily)